MTKCFGSLVLGLACVATLNLKADQTVSATTPATAVAPTTPASKPPAALVPNAAHAASPYGGQMALTPEENKILAKARLDLQKDPDIVAINAEIKALLEKRAKLTEEKLKTLSPEAEAILQKLKERQEKMMAERKAQMEAMQAKVKVPSAPAKPMPTPATPAAGMPPAPAPTSTP